MQTPIMVIEPSPDTTRPTEPVTGILVKTPSEVKSTVVHTDLHPLAHSSEINTTFIAKPTILTPTIVIEQASDAARLPGPMTAGLVKTPSTGTSTTVYMEPLLPTPSSDVNSMFIADDESILVAESYAMPIPPSRPTMLLDKHYAPVHLGVGSRL